jgi:hypothetical protein
MRPNVLFAALLGTVVLVSDQQGAQAQGFNLDTAAIEQATGLKGQIIAEENVFKVSKPRTDGKSRSTNGPCRPSWVLAPGLRSRPLMVAQC